MPIQLLSANAAPFSSRQPPNIVLNSKVDPWLTATLKRVNKVRRPLNSVPQHHRCLTDCLAQSSAIWTLCHLFLPRAPLADLLQDDNPLMEAVHNWQMISIEAYVVHVDMVSQNEVAYKLTPESIERLIEYHKDVHSVDMKAATFNWSEKDAQLQKLHEDFVQACNRYVYRTSSTALEGLEEDGAGELLCGRSDEVKNAIMGMFLPLLPPPPRPVDIVRPTPVLPSSTEAEIWWQNTVSAEYPSATENWKYAPADPVYTSADSGAGLWAHTDLSDFGAAEMSPSSTYSDPYSASPSPPQYYSLPVTSAPLSQVPLPSTLMHQQCSPSVGLGYGGFNWDDYQNFAPMPYAM